MRTLLSALEAHAAAWPGKPFLLCGSQGRWTQFSFHDALGETKRWAAHWAALRLPRGSVVCIALPHAPELYFLFLGAMRAGLVPAFLAFPTPKQKPEVYWAGLEGLLERTRPGCVLAMPEQLLAVAAIAPPNCAVLDVARLAAGSGPVPPMGGGVGTGLALLQHSSGTTGAKKGVALSFEQIRLQVEAYAGALDIGPEDRVASWLPLYHDMGLITGFLLPLTLGMTVVALDAFEWAAKPVLLFEAIELVGATFAWLPNFAFAHLVRMHEPGARFALGSMRGFISCSEPCKPETGAAFLTAFASSGVRADAMLTCYAMAETVFAVTQSPRGGPAHVLRVAAGPLQEAGIARPVPPESGARAVGLLSCGVPVAGAGIGIRDAQGRVGRAADLVGEIVVRAPFLFDGYFRNAADTAAAFDGSWYRTGDLGFLHGGELYVTGRLKDVIIVHGRNFYAHDIEQAVGEVEGIRPGRVAAFAQFSEGSASEEVVVVAETGTEEGAGHEALRRAVRAHVFSRLELTVWRIDLCGPGTMIKTTSGKVSRDENARRFATRTPHHAGDAVHG